MSDSRTRMLRVPRAADDMARAVAPLLRDARRVLLCTHVHADGDTLGSMLAVGLAMRQVSAAQVTMVSPDLQARTYAYLPSIGDVVPALSAAAVFDVAAVFDCDQFSRVGAELMAALGRCPVVIDVDHHPSVPFGTHHLHDTAAAATGELSARLIAAIGARVTPEIATCLLTAVMTDTSRFLFPNTTPATLRFAADWHEAGGAYDTITERLFARRSWPTTQLLARILRSTTLHDDGRIAVATLGLRDFRESAGEDLDSEGLVNYLGDIEGVQFAALLREVSPGEVRVSFRSRCDVSVRPAAVQFGGGGHDRAAGCSLTGDLVSSAVAVRECLEAVLHAEVGA